MAPDGFKLNTQPIRGYNNSTIFYDDHAFNEVHTTVNYEYMKLDDTIPKGFKGYKEPDETKNKHWKKENKRKF